MLQVFRDCCLRAFRQNGNIGMLKLWALTLFDLVRSLFDEHLQKETFMTKSKFIKLSGWTLTVGSLAFVSILGGSIAGSAISSILIAIGMLGLRVRYGEITGSLGKNVLLAGIAGMALAYIAVPAFRDAEISFILPFAGPAVLLTGLTLFGLVALRRKPLSRWNALPFLAGIWYPAIYFPIFVYILMNKGTWSENDFPWALIQIMISIQFLALCMLGAILQADMTENTAVPA